MGPATLLPQVMSFAVDMLRVASTVTLPHSGEPVQVRIGINSGPIMRWVGGWPGDV